MYDGLHRCNNVTTEEFKMMIELSNFTNPDKKTYIDPKSISAIEPSAMGDGSGLLISGQWLSVKETPEQVREKMVAAQ